MPKAKNVTVIPATLNIHTKTPTTERVRRRVAAYARVSTDSEEQLTSYEAQVDYYTKFIREIRIGTSWRSIPMRVSVPSTPSTGTASIV